MAADEFFSRGGWFQGPDYYNNFFWRGGGGWLALPRWLLSRYYMNRASPEPPFLYRDWKQCAKAVCYPLSWFSIGSFTRPPGKHDNLENFQQDRGIIILGSTLTRPAQLSCNRKVDCLLIAFNEGAEISAKRALSPAHVIRARLHKTLLR